MIRALVIKTLVIRALVDLKRNALTLHDGDPDRMVISTTLLKGNRCDGDGDCDGVGDGDDGDDCGGQGSGSYGHLFDFAHSFNVRQYLLIILFFFNINNVSRFDSSRWGGGSDGHLYDFVKRGFQPSRWGSGSDGHLYDFAKRFFCSFSTITII